MHDPALAAALALSRRDPPQLTLEGLDPDRIAAHALRLGTAPAVLGALQRLLTLPDDHPLLHPREATLLTNLIALDAAERAIATLHDAGLRTLPLKGLAALLGPLALDPAARAMHDLDILIDDDGFARAQRALHAAGWRRDRPAPLASALGPEARFHLDQHGVRVLLELHRTLTFPGRHTPDTDALWRRSTPGPLGTRCLDPIDQLVYLAFHKSMHGYLNDLRDLVDADALLRQPGLPLHDLPPRARAWRAAGPTWLLLLRARQTFGTPLPPGLLDALRPSTPRADALQDLLPDLALRQDLRPLPNHLRPRRQRLLTSLLAHDCPPLEAAALSLVAARGALDALLPPHLPEGHPLLRLADQLPLRPLERLIPSCGPDSAASIKK